MNITTRLFRCAAVCLPLALGACGGGDGGADGNPASLSGTVVGAGGGTVFGPNGAKVEVPPGALAADTVIRIEQSSAGAPALPGDFSAQGQMFAFTPHGTTFSLPVTLTLPFDGAGVQPGMTPALYKTNSQNLWERVANVSFGTDTVSAQITSFSNGQPGIELRQCPKREWFINRTAEPPFWGQPIAPFLNGEQTCGEVLVPFVLGRAELAFEQDNGATPNLATAEVFSSADGGSFSAYTEATGEAGLRQWQSYVKRAAGATLQIVLSSGFLAAADFNGRPLQSECRDIRLENLSDEEIFAFCIPLLDAITFKSVAYTNTGRANVDNRNFFSTAGIAELFGFHGKWKFYAVPLAGGRSVPWTEANFTVTGLDGSTPLAALNAPVVINVDLSSIEVCPPDLAAIFCADKAFTLFSFIHAESRNSRGRESGTAAFLRDPQHIGGSALRITGLEATNNPLPLPSDQLNTIACSSGSDQAAGVLQFNAASFAGFEGTGTRGMRDIRVTRTQGSKGAVSVNLTAGGGTALSGIDYEPLAVNVQFADGDNTPRLVRVNLLSNAVVEPDKTLSLTLSDPGGCATLGPQSTAALTILDDDNPPLPPASGLDPTFGDAGKAFLSGFGGSGSAMAVQGDGRMVMVGGSTTDFLLARFNADGSVDTGFGAGGKVTTDLLGGTADEEVADAIAIQSDGKIIVVGYTGIFGRPARSTGNRFDFALVRYNADGSLDSSFGSGGKVTAGVVGRAFAVALQRDGKIVVAGDAPLTQDFALARYNTDGSLDSSFGIGGQLTTDIAGTANVALNVVLQPNGAIVASGAGLDHTDVVRYNANGSPDNSFGVGGKLVLAGTLVGQGLVLQGDGKLVLVGGATEVTAPATARFVVMRLDADGSPDTSFGNAGKVDKAFNESARASAVALQRDGKIVAVGARVLSANANFIAARYNTDGSLDVGFGVGGVLSFDFFFLDDIGESVVVQPDGKIVVGGGVNGSRAEGYGLVRINP